jgi:histidyl-tRNA synthetase
MSRKATPFKAPIGTVDVLPPDSERLLAFRHLFEDVARDFGFGYLETPVFEDVGVFQRVGEGTDVVRKEMYEFVDRGDRRLALRPEGTAPVCRAFAQNRPPTPWKVWYHAPMFRYERPQAGRNRQHTQVGAEILGSHDPDVDVEVIAFAREVMRRTGLERVLLLINSMGDRACRRRFVDALREYLRENVGDLDPEDRDKVDDHPMRVLDTKRPDSLDVVRDAPTVLDHLDDASRLHFDRVQDGLGALGIPFAIETRLVRGLDYYTHTTFEFQASALDAAQNTVAGGGRYDGLVEELGGPPTPGVGFGMGVERLLLACDAESTFSLPHAHPDVWVIDVHDGTSARDLTNALRAAGVAADRAFDNRSMRAQMKAADRSGARWALIVGDKEVADGTVALRDLRSGDEQRPVLRADVVTEVVALVSGTEG